MKSPFSCKHIYTYEKNPDATVFFPGQVIIFGNPEPSSAKVHRSPGCPGFAKLQSIGPHQEDGGFDRAVTRLVGWWVTKGYYLGNQHTSTIRNNEHE